VRVDLHEKRQLDLAEHVARVNQHVAKANVRAQPWRAIIAGVVGSNADPGFKD
jgi:hypothetical protein